MFDPTTTLSSTTPPLAISQTLTKMTFKLFSFFPILIFIFLQFPFSMSDVIPDEYLYQSCANTFSCGSITGIGYPFSGNTIPEYCGFPGLDLNCKNKNVTTIEINSMRYRVLGINQNTKTMRLAREDMMETTCPQDLTNTTMDNSLFQFSSKYNIITFLYECPNSYAYSYSSIPSDSSSDSSSLDSVPSCVGYDMVYYVEGDKNPLGCNKSVTVPILVSNGLVDIGNWTKIEENIRKGFEVELKVDNKACVECIGSNGRCGYNIVNNRSACYCPTAPFVTDTTCHVAVEAPTSPVLSLPEKGSSRGKELLIAVPITGAVLALLGIGLAIFAYKKRKNQDNSVQSSQSDSKDNAFSSISKGLTFTTTPSANFSQSVPSYASSKLDSSKSSSYFGVQVFTYTELEEATNNFDTSRELGEGGFGTVYFGKLKDDRIVAVKRLYENNYKRIEQFMNELDILTRLRHDNLVTLYGCTSRRSRELLLVYEYVPNGTVADHLYGSNSLSTASLSWPTRLKIAVETADALAYLHKSDIIHRDVKTNNILLDNDFKVKVADFGLSRLFPTDVTHVSTAPQGTPGYVDPEYHNCYHLTEKSDVYSFGVVLIELISSKQAVDTSRNRLDINLANMAINRIQNGDLRDLVDPIIGFETDSLVRRKITLVAELAFRCLQTERDMRPSMDEIVKALRGIKNGNLGSQQEEVVEIVIEDDVALLKGRSTPVSPRSPVTEKQARNSSMRYSSG